MLNKIDDRETEFKDFVWDHAADAFQLSFDARRELKSDEVAYLSNIRSAILEADDERALQSLRKVLLSDVSLFSLLLQTVGLTRSKILSDMKANTSLSAKGIKVPGSYQAIPDSSVWLAAGPYLLMRLRTVFGPLDPNKLTLAQVFESLNQSTWPGYIRQERAKRSGHEAEYRLATLFSNIGIPFVPEEKAENPLCKDAQIAGISFDLVIPSIEVPKIVFKATVHTANIGQFGESKDHLEIDEARRWIESLQEGQRPTLVAFIDGVGFQSNRAGLLGVLEKSDEFFQFRTIWKAVVIVGSVTGRIHQMYIPKTTIGRFQEFLIRHNATGHVLPREGLHDAVGLVEAGDALINPDPI